MHNKTTKAGAQAFTPARVLYRPDSMPDLFWKAYSQNSASVGREKFIIRMRVTILSNSVQTQLQQRALLMVRFLFAICHFMLLRFFVICGMEINGLWTQIFIKPVTAVIHIFLTKDFSSQTLYSTLMHIKIKNHIDIIILIICLLECGDGVGRPKRLSTVRV